MSPLGDHHDHEPTGDDHEQPPVTDTVHDNSWSVNLETPQYAADPDLAVRHAREAIEHTTAGNHVNLVTHRELGRPEGFLGEALESIDGIEWEYVDQCGCGGHVTRVHVE